MTASKNMLTTRQFAQRAAVSASTVSKWLREGKISGIKESGKWMISADQLPREEIQPPKADAPEDAVKNRATAHPPRGFSVEEFSRMTYLTPLGVERYLKEGRLSGSRDGSGKWRIDTANLEKSDIKRLLR